MTVIASESRSAPLAIRLFGAMQVQIHGRPMPHLRSRKALWLLALLALRHDRPVEREWLAGVLWPDTDQTRAFTSLRANLSELRRALGDQGARLQSPGRHTLLLDLTGADADIVTFDAAIKSRQAEALKQSVVLYIGPLLEDCAEEWVGQERNAREQDCLRALQTLADTALAAGDYPAAIECYRRAVSLDPWAEAARRGWMEALAKSGDRNAALQVYREFAELLRSDPNAAPDGETSALYARLRAQARRQTDSLPVVPAAETIDNAAVSLQVNGYLPHPLTDLIGREEERSRVAAKLRGARLVTLTGLGGIGKTRLAIEVAGESVHDGAAYPDGVWLVALESLPEGKLVAAQIASVLGVREEVERSLLESLIGHLRAKRLLLVLDNCEHLLGACAQIIGRILQECARVRILATSRETLGIMGETVWQVPSLAAPDPKHLREGDATLPQVLQVYASVQLFVARAQAGQKEFTLSAGNAMAVAQVCFQLEGIPLAVELAAARVRALTVEQIAARLNDRLGLLAVGNRAAQSRQQTLRAALDWSYALLSEAERVLLGRLSVFTGGWTLEAAEAVCVTQESRTNKIQKQDVLNLLASLVDKSLAAFEGRAGEAGGRYRLLETVRQYAMEKLQASGEIEELSTRNRDWFVALANAEVTKLMEADPRMSLRRLEREYDNLRAVLEWCETDSGSAEAGLQIAGALGRFLYLRGRNSEGRKYLEWALGREEVQAATIVRARALNGAGVLASVQGDYAAAQTLLEESLRFYRERADKPNIAVVVGNLGLVYNHLGDHVLTYALYEESFKLHQELGDSLGMSRALNKLGILASKQGEDEKAQALLTESLRIREELGDRRGIAVASNNLGNVALNQEKYALARSLYEEGLRINRELEDRQGVAVSLDYLGNVACSQGEYVTAQALHEESLQLFQELGDQSGIASLLHDLGNVAYATHAFAEARSLYEESLKLFQKLRDKSGVTVSLDGVAMVVSSQGEIHKAVGIWGAVYTLRETLGIPLLRIARERYDQQVEQARSVLGENTFDALWEQGRVLSWEQAVAAALKSGV